MKISFSGKITSSLGPGVLKLVQLNYGIAYMNTIKIKKKLW
jgi:hypothetical protein